MTSTFWGLRLEPGKRYSTTVDKSFHVSMAALDCNTVKNDKEVQSVMLEEDESNVPFILCNLQKPKVLQSPLDLTFVSGDRVTFFCRGNGIVHLTGYIISDEDDLVNFGGEEVEEEEEEDEEEEEEAEDEGKVTEVSSKGKAKVNGLPSNKRKVETAGGLPTKKKKQELPEQGDSDEDSDDDDDLDDDDDDDVDEDDSGEEEDDEMESEEESDEEVEAEEKKPVPSPTSEQKGKKKKKNKQDLQQPSQLSSTKQQQPKQKQQNAVNGPQQQNAAQQKKKQQQQPANEKSAEGQQQPKKTLEGGVQVKDVKVGNGPICKPGRMATVYYTGRLKSNNKVFDQTQQGPGFKFRVGRGEVIKGWDVGLAGMKVGGKRFITCPPNMAYGAKGSPPTIPGNSTLVFEVELKGVS